MQINVMINDDLVEKARNLTGIGDLNTLLKAGLNIIVQRESALRLARLGGSDPNATRPPRRRSLLS